MLKKIISVSNQKGGVGKTTTAINLAALLALSGQKVLLIDSDSQANCTSGVGVDNKMIKKNIYNIFFEHQIDDGVIVKTEFENLWLIASDAELVGLDIELIDLPHRDFILKQRLHTVSNQFDYIIIDCPPSLNLLTLNALNASDSVLIPVQCGYFALEGLTQLLKTIQLVKENSNPQLTIEGFLLTMVEDGHSLSETIVHDVRDYFKEQVFQTQIAKDHTLSVASSFGKPIVYYDPRAMGAEDYVNFTYELKETCQPRERESSSPIYAHV